MNYSSSSWQEWLTVFIYLGITFFIMWRVFSTQQK